MSNAVASQKDRISWITWLTPKVIRTLCVVLAVVGLAGLLSLASSLVGSDYSRVESAGTRFVLLIFPTCMIGHAALLLLSVFRYRRGLLNDDLATQRTWKPVGLFAYVCLTVVPLSVGGLIYYFDTVQKPRIDAKIASEQKAFQENWDEMRASKKLQNQ